MKPRPSRKISHKPSEKEVRSRLRRFIWAEVRKVFERLMKVRMAKQLDFKEVEEVIREVMREQSDTDVSYVLAQVLNVDLTVCPALSFEPFVQYTLTPGEVLYYSCRITRPHKIPQPSPLKTHANSIGIRKCIQGRVRNDLIV
jgi:hypothetical protein